MGENANFLPMTENKQKTNTQTCLRKIRVCIHIWEYVMCLYCIYTVGHAYISCILERKMQIPGQRLLIITCGSSLHCPDDNDCWWLKISSPALQNIEGYTNSYCLFTLHWICDSVSMRHEKCIMSILPAPALLPLFSSSTRWALNW